MFSLLFVQRDNDCISEVLRWSPFLPTVCEQILELIELRFTPVLIDFCWDAIMPYGLPTFSCIVAFLISSRVAGSSSSSFRSAWGILASEESCTVCWSLKRPAQWSDQRWRMAFLSFSGVLPSEESGSDVRAHRLLLMPQRRRGCHPSQHNIVSSQPSLA